MDESDDDSEDERLRREEEEALARQDRLRRMLQQAEAEHQALARENADLQRKLVPLLHRKPDAGEAKEEKSSFAELEKNYRNSLKGVMQARETLDKTNKMYDRAAMDLQARLDQKEAIAHEIHESFLEFKREIFKGAENSKLMKTEGNDDVAWDGVARDDVA